MRGIVAVEVAPQSGVAELRKREQQIDAESDEHDEAGREDGWSDVRDDLEHAGVLAILPVAGPVAPFRAASTLDNVVTSQPSVRPAAVLYQNREITAVTASGPYTAAPNDASHTSA
jgi:hypothetical protein